jgi:hypothetical protein
LTLAGGVRDVSEALPADVGSPLAHCGGISTPRSLHCARRASPRNRVRRPHIAAVILFLFFCPWRVGAARRLEWRDSVAVAMALVEHHLLAVVRPALGVRQRVEALDEADSRDNATVCRRL